MTSTSVASSTGSSSGGPPPCVCEPTTPGLEITSCATQVGCVGTCYYNGAGNLSTSAGVLSGPGCGPQGYTCSSKGQWVLTTPNTSLCKNDPKGCAKLDDETSCINTPGCRWVYNQGTAGQLGPVLPFSQACFPATNCAVPNDCGHGAICVGLSDGIGCVWVEVCGFCGASKSPCMVDLDCCGQVCDITSNTCA
jgi:hypothetical protein